MGPLNQMQVRTSAEFARNLNEAQKWLCDLDASPEKLRATLSRLRGRQVGLFFEELMAFWLEHQSTYKLLARNLQVREQGRTLGAFDFILQTPELQFEHWELTVKFYLQRSSSLDWDAWVGPNGRDRLDIKMARMADHQLPLSLTDTGRQALHELGVEDDICRRAVLKGIFFSEWESEPRFPHDANINNEQGVWVRQSGVKRFAQQYASSFFVNRQKPDWLAPLHLSFEDAAAAGEWADQLKDVPLDGGVMVSRLEPTGGGDLVEHQRLFVVRDDWPASQP
jgi:uncharacterized protein